MNNASYFQSLLDQALTPDSRSYNELIEQLAWAEAEVTHTQDALTNLQFRLQHGILVMEDIAAEAEEIITRHQAVLITAHARRSEFQQQMSQIESVIGIAEDMWTFGEE